MKKLLFEELYEKIIKEDAETIYPSSLDGMKKDKARKRVNNLFSDKSLWTCDCIRCRIS